MAPHVPCDRCELAFPAATIRHGGPTGSRTRTGGRTMGRYSRLHAIRRMDPTRDYAEILRLISQYEFPWDYRQGVSVAFLRDYGVPRISVLLDRTQEFERAGQKRYDDTV